LKVVLWADLLAAAMVASLVGLSVGLMGVLAVADWAESSAARLAWKSAGSMDMKMAG
jgi:hypothetical protein